MTAKAAYRPARESNEETREGIHRRRAGVFGSAHATVRYAEAQIIDIEVSETQIFLFFQVMSGDVPPLGNRGTLSLPSRPYLTLAGTAAEIDSRRHMLATALTAKSSGAPVRIRWGDASSTSDRVEYLLIRE